MAIINFNLRAFLVVPILVFAMKSVAANPPRVLLISDIDDTIKVSHVLSKTGMAARAANVTVRFSGMAQLYQLIVNENPSSTQIVYLSNAPQDLFGIEPLKYLHQAFLSYNRFPPGTLDLRADIFEKDHKIKELRRMIEAEKPDVVIMIGDNGEMDTEIYKQATLEMKDKPIKMVTFIHQLYATEISEIDKILGLDSMAEVGKKLQPGQTGFVTPIEIALELAQQGLLKSESVQWMESNVGTYIANESYFDSDSYGPITFPSFMRCQDFKWTGPRAKETNALVKKIDSVCK